MIEGYRTIGEIKGQNWIPTRFQDDKYKPFGKPTTQKYTILYDMNDDDVHSYGHCPTNDCEHKYQTTCKNNPNGLIHLVKTKAQILLTIVAAVPSLGAISLSNLKSNVFKILPNYIHQH